MPARTIEESIQFREWIDRALADGCQNPTEVIEWINQRKGAGQEAPSLPTVSKIMKKLGYKSLGSKWVKGR